MAKERFGRQPKQAKPSASIPKRETHFLGIGIDNYTGHWPRLNNAVRDVKAVAALLQQAYDLSHTEFLFNERATRRNIINTLDRLTDELNEANNLIIYYAGHGHYKTSTKRGFWVPVDATDDDVSQYIRNSTIKDYIRDINSHHTLLLSDACFSGSLFVRAQRSSQLNLDELRMQPSRWAICSGRQNETVADGPEDGHSPFAQSLLDVLGNSRREVITANFLYEQVRMQTRSNYTQLPDGGPLFQAGDRRGEFVFTRKQDEKARWTVVKTTHSISSYEAYLAAFPTGQFVEQAQAAVTKLKAEAAW
ncbi:MAG: caspase family protein, partial [Bacteroidota bacterium]